MSTTWKYEVDQDRYWEAWYRDLSGTFRLPGYVCSSCGSEFATEAERAEHIGSSHTKHTPALLLGNMPAPRTLVVRTRTVLGQIKIQDSSRVKVSKNGGEPIEYSSKTLLEQLALENNAYYRITLGDTEQLYALTVAIADRGFLQEVDRIFIELLAVDSPSMAGVQRFGELCDRVGPVTEYADALGNYVTGLIIKDQDRARGATLDFANFKEKFQRSLHVLKDYLCDRHDPPVPETVCACVRLNLNLFDFDAPPSGVPLLDKCLDFLKSVYECGNVLVRVDDQLGTNSGRPICPRDLATQEVIEAFLLLCRPKGDSARLIADLNERARRGDLSEYDRAKLQTTLAIALLRLEDRSAARELLLSLAQDQTFGRWAERQLGSQNENA